MAEALAKAAEAVRKLACGWGPVGGEPCPKICSVRSLEVATEEVVYAVLEAVGIDEIAKLLAEALVDAKDQRRRCYIYMAGQSCEPCGPGGCAVAHRIQRIEAVLRDLGKGGAP